MQKRDEAAKAIFPKFLASLVVFGIIGVLVGLLSLAFASLLAAKEIFTMESLQSVPVAASFISGILSGYLAAKSMGKALVTGILQAAVNLAVMYLLGLAVYMRLVPTGYCLNVFLACIIGCVLGAMLTTVSFSKKHRRRYA